LPVIMDVGIFETTVVNALQQQGLWSWGSSVSEVYWH
jgi:hypothetical protein